MQTLGVRALGRRRRIMAAAAELRTSVSASGASGGAQQHTAAGDRRACHQPARKRLPGACHLSVESLTAPDTDAAVFAPVLSAAPAAAAASAATSVQWRGEVGPKRITDFCHIECHCCTCQAHRQEPQQRRHQRQRHRAQQGNGAATWGQSASPTSLRRLAAGRRRRPSSSRSRCSMHSNPRRKDMQS